MAVLPVYVAFGFGPPALGLWPTKSGRKPNPQLPLTFTGMTQD